MREQRLEVTMGKRLKVGVVGVGSLGQWHADIYSKLPNAELIGVMDVREDRAREIAQKYGVRAFPDLDSLAGAVEAASVVVPAHRHFEIASKLIEAGVHLLVEKPIAAATADAEAMVAAATARRVILQVGHVERFNPVLQFLDQHLERPRFIEAIRLQPYPPPRPDEPPRGTEVSVVLDLMIHDIEAILHLVRSPVREIRAVGVPVLSRSEDIANVRLAFESGCIANITASRVSQEKMRKIRVFQEDTYLSLDYQNQTGQLCRRIGEQVVRTDVPIEKGEPLAHELASFVDCILRRHEPVVSGREGFEALKLAVTICQQVRTSPS